MPAAAGTHDTLNGRVDPGPRRVGRGKLGGMTLKAAAGQFMQSSVKVGLSRAPTPPAGSTDAMSRKLKEGGCRNVPVAVVSVA